MNDRSWLGALTGLGFLVLAIASVAVGGGEPPDPSDDPVEEIVEFYVDNEAGSGSGPSSRRWPRRSSSSSAAT